MAAHDAGPTDDFISVNDGVRHSEEGGDIVFVLAEDPAAFGHAAIAAGAAVAACQFVTGNLTAGDREGSAAVVDAAAGSKAAAPADTAVAAGGAVVGDGAVRDGHRCSLFGKEAAALTFAAIAQRAAVATNDHVPGDRRVAERDRADRMLDTSAPGIAALAAVAALAGNDVVVGESADGYSISQNESPIKDAANSNA